jgi:tight adherence protein B
MLGVMIGIMVGVILVLGTGTYFLLNYLQNKKQKSRVLSVIRGEAPVPAEKAEKDLKEKRRAEIARKLEESGSVGKSKKRSDLKMKLVQAGLAISIKQFYLFSFLFSCIATLLSVMAGQNPIMTLGVAFISMFGVPRLFLKWKTKRRQKKFLEDFADALEAMVRLLKAGMPVTEAIAMASREFGGPIGEEMSKIYESQRIGMSLPEAVLESARRMPITEMQMFATGVSIQAQTGSSLSEVLTNLARVIRARFRLKRKVDALSAEAKASAMIIGALPFLVGGGMYLINKDFIMVLFTTPVGKAWMIGSVCWMLLGCLVMRQMINFKV